jgi:hypothetical protein
VVTVNLGGKLIALTINNAGTDVAGLVVQQSIGKTITGTATNNTYNISQIATDLGLSTVTPAVGNLITSAINSALVGAGVGTPIVTVAGNTLTISPSGN